MFIYNKLSLISNSIFFSFFSRFLVVHTTICHKLMNAKMAVNVSLINKIEHLARHVGLGSVFLLECQKLVPGKS